MLGGVGPPELEPGAQVGADHMISGEDEKGPELVRRQGWSPVELVCWKPDAVDCFRWLVHM